MQRNILSFNRLASGYPLLFQKNYLYLNIYSIFAQFYQIFIYLFNRHSGIPDHSGRMASLLQVIHSFLQHLHGKSKDKMARLKTTVFKFLEILRYISLHHFIKYIILYTFHQIIHIYE